MLRKLRLRGVKWLAEDLTAEKQRSWVSNLHSLTSEHVLFTALQYWTRIILTLQAEGLKGHELGAAKSAIVDARSEEGEKVIQEVLEKLEKRDYKVIIAKK